MNDFRVWLVVICVALVPLIGCGDAPPPEPKRSDEAEPGRDAGRNRVDAGDGSPTLHADAASMEPRDAGPEPMDAALGLDSAIVDDPSPQLCLADGSVQPATAASEQCADPEDFALTWRLSNLAPCLFSASDGQTFLYSSSLTDAGRLDCGQVDADAAIPPEPHGTWSDSELNAACAGMFTLCLTIKAGDVANPRADDCVITRSCEDVWYEHAGVSQVLEPLPSWVASDATCSAAFDQRGGYAEMSVMGKTIECQAIDDGQGHPMVFHRSSYCPTSCAVTPDTTECIQCATGGSGMANP